MNLIDLTGKKFGRLTVIERCGSDKDSKPMWKCLCDCGNTAIVRGYCLRRKTKPTKSCGCLIPEIASNTMKNKVLHGHCVGFVHTKLYRHWITIKQRCFCENNNMYHNYGGRGITMFNEWIHNFKAFADYIGNPPDKYSTVDRINNDKGYEPGNIRWATRKEQANNRRDNVKVTYNDQTMTLTQWAENLGIKPVTFFSRRRLGWTIEQILTTPVKNINLTKNTISAADA